MTSAAVASARRRLSTPTILRCFIGAIVALALLAGAIALQAARATGEAAQTIGRDAEPSVALGLRMATTLAEIDSDALGDSLIDNGAAIGTSLRFRSGLMQLSNDAAEAARNITYGEAEAAPLRALAHFLLLYQEAIVIARTTAGGSNWLLSQRLKWASRVDRDLAVPQAIALAQANADQLERIYGAYQQSAMIQIIGVAAGYALLLACLVGVQIWLTRTMQRLINPLLLAASLVVVVGGVWVVAAISAQKSDLRAAKSDAYDSLHALFEAKSEAYALRADASLWLLDTGARVPAQAAIDRDLGALISLDLRQASISGPILQKLSEALARERAGRPDESAALTPHVGGLLGKELDNITFGVDERQAASDSVAALAHFARMIAAIQGLEQQGDHADAVVRWVSERPGDGDEAVRAVIAALDRTIGVNQTAFDEHAGAALASMNLAPRAIVLSLLLATLLAAGGLWPRLNEYR